jgi:L-threonylcarbamoyladenylate synthase
MIDVISLAVKMLLSGDVVALPTETVYGLAASIKSESALRKIFQVKGRPLLDPLIVHILDSTWISRCAFVDNLDAQIKALTNAFWPGPLTLVLRKKPEISAIVTSGSDFVALRCPAHEMFREVLRLVDVPLAAPSANPFGYLSPTTAEHVNEILGNKIKLVVDGGKCSVGVESTILDMTTNVPRVVRPGKVSASDIASVLCVVVQDYDATVVLSAVPGQSKQHYSPNTRLVLFGNIDDVSDLISDSSKNLAFVFLNRPECFFEKNIFWLSENGDYAVVASSLFDMLHMLDKSGYDAIYFQRAEHTGLGVAINDRLVRAAAKFSGE